MGKSRVDFSDIFEELRASNLEPIVLRRPARQLSMVGVLADSRKIEAGQIYCAIRGEHHDGHDFLGDPSQQIDLAIIERQDIRPEDIAADGIIHVTSTRAAWAQLSSFFCGHPAAKLIMMGVTGTNGKTSSTWMIRSIVEALSIPCATIGTLGIQTPKGLIETTHTTPDPDILYPTLQNLVEQGVKAVAMEVSSHSLAQGKVWPIRFGGAGFTSFSQDHLDFHKTMEAYLDAKLLLFEKFLLPGAPALFHAKLLENRKIEALWGASKTFKTYGIGLPKGDYAVAPVTNSLLGMTSVTIKDKFGHNQFEIPMIGDVFSENFALAVSLTSEVLNIPLAKIADSLKGRVLSAVPGRLELVRDPKLPWRPLVYVDYAHTPDALEKALKSLTRQGSRLSVIFGCGGDRDKSKRPLMGQIAAALADNVYVTSDNPRTEDPAKIIDDILMGTQPRSVAVASGGVNLCVIPERKRAIVAALGGRGGSDTVLIAGKGHENYQIIGKSKHPFSDSAVALEALRKPRLWLVFGGGVSGFAAAEHLVTFGEKVIMSDDRAVQLPPALKDAVTWRSLDQMPWDDISTIVVSPGVPPSHTVYKKAVESKTRVISEIDLGLDCFKGKILAVSGTNGKSTTVAMTEFLGLKLGRPIKACGNIGLPPSALNLRVAPTDQSIALEISSYQLEGSQTWAADAACITSFSQDHLARHNTMDAYFRTKWRLAEWVKPGSPFIISTDVARFAIGAKVPWPKAHIVIVGPGSSSLPVPAPFEAIDIAGGFCEISGQRFNLQDFGIQGLHNQSNAIFAALMVQSLSNRPLIDCFQSLTQFKGLPFRCQTAFQNKHVRVINDSKSTNLESTLSALTLLERPAILLMGGQGKGEPYGGLSAAKDKIHKLITFGASASQISRDVSSFLPSEIFDKMEAAVLHALRLARDNRVDVVFSPGCASFDEFKNFEHRGETFDRIVNKTFKDFI